VISPSQRPLPDNTRENAHFPGGIPTHNPSKEPPQPSGSALLYIVYIFTINGLLSATTHLFAQREATCQVVFKEIYQCILKPTVNPNNA
jgi:hypothetical protein